MIYVTLDIFSVYESFRYLNAKSENLRIHKLGIIWLSNDLLTNEF